ncbi:molybdenum cofactor biosynthesis protein MoaE [bacterium]|nr:molybdenum cofactor biosynthesis protein MoaE [bacterium]
MDSTNTPPIAVRDLVTVSDEVIDTASLVDFVADDAAGATVLFLGTVRDHAPGREGVTHLEYEAYGEVVEGKIAGIVAEARERWPIIAAAAVHRVGSLGVGEVSVAVSVSSAHRVDAFAAGRYLIDELKGRAPIWKKEHWPGGAEWVREDIHHGSGDA